MIIKKPITVSDTTRFSNTPELILSHVGQDKSLRNVGYIIANHLMSEELNLGAYMYLTFGEDHGRKYIILSGNSNQPSGIYKLTDMSTTVRNQALFNELAAYCGVDFTEYDTIHFPNVEYFNDEYGGYYAAVDVAEYYGTEGKHIPYEEEFVDDWEDLYDGQDDE